MNNIAGRCRCCGCQGIYCLIPHPGHTHRPILTSTKWYDILRELPPKEERDY